MANMSSRFESGGSRVQTRYRADATRGSYRWLIFLAGLLLAGCATSTPSASGSRRFIFEQDTFAYANELVWEYHLDEHGKWTHRSREPKSDYTHHCFVVARSAKQFFQNARFDPAQPKADSATYRRRIRKVVSASPRKRLPEVEKIVIPGYANLRAFSEAQQGLLKTQCGGAWQSYFQRGHWRMIWPFSRNHQCQTAERLLREIKSNATPVVHLVRFPSLTINHAVLLFEVRETADRVEFAAYDPNSPERTATLTYDRARRSFSFPANSYFPGGRVDAYEIYRNWCY
jgi:hypothetical protein